MKVGRPVISTLVPLYKTADEHSRDGKITITPFEKSGKKGFY